MPATWLTSPGTARLSRPVAGTESAERQAAILQNLCRGPRPVPGTVVEQSCWRSAWFGFGFSIFSLSVLSPLPPALPRQSGRAGVGMVLVVQRCPSAATAAPRALPGIVPSTCRGGWGASGEVWDRIPAALAPPEDTDIVFNPWHLPLGHTSMPGCCGRAREDGITRRI